MDYFLLGVSIISTALQNAVLNKFSKEMLKSSADNYFFNMVQYIFTFLIFAVLSVVSGKISWFTVILGALFGLVTVLASVYKISALSLGPMHITMMIITASMIIPALSGVFFGEKLSVLKLVFIAVLVFFIYLSLSKDKGGAGINRRWAVATLLVFLLAGAIGIMQKIHQSSVYKDESASFLAACFLVSILYSAIMMKKEKGGRTVKFNIKHYALAAVSGLCVYAMNHINLYLSGVMPSQIFFPLVNGAALLLTLLISVLLFKERLSGRQLVGVAGGFVSLIAICLL